MFGLGSVFYTLLLFINAIAVLDQERFLARVGLTSASYHDPNSIKSQLVNLISAIRTLLRFPLIVLNSLVIVYELLLG